MKEKKLSKGGALRSILQEEEEDKEKDKEEGFFATNARSKW